MKSLFLAALILLVGSASLHGEQEQAQVKQGLTPGVAISHAITETTGIAISPLLGVTAVGSWTYFRTEPEMRDDLNWYCQPWAWGTGLAILILCFLKDSVGSAVPGPLKKPFDVAELLENKISGILAGGTVIPIIIMDLTRAAATGPVEVSGAAVGMDLAASIDASWITIPLAMIAFGIVWVCSHVVNVLIILSPFSTVDTLLKISRSAVLGLVVMSYAIAPWLGAAFCGCILLIACFLAPGAIRLSNFGTRIALDVVMPWRARKRAVPATPKAFTVARLGKLPKRICGRLGLSGEGKLQFNYRRWFSSKASMVEAPAGKYLVAKGLITPSIVHINEKGKMRRIMILLPRYRGREQEVSDALRLNGIQPFIWKRGWSAIKDAWAQWRGREVSVEEPAG